MALRLDRAAGQTARPHPRGGLRGAQRPDHERGRERRHHEHGLVQGEHVPAHGLVAADLGADHERNRGEGSQREASALALEVRVRCDEEERRRAHRAEHLGLYHLEDHEDHHVADRDERVQRLLGRAAREHEVGHSPREGDQAEDGGGATLVGKAPQHDPHERQDDQGEPRGGEDDHRLPGLDRQPAQHQAAALERVRARVRIQSAAAAAPAVSIAQSSGEPLRVSTKLWWNSSVAA